MVKELVLIGSQSGVGKTSIAAALVSLLKEGVVLDCTSSQNLQRFFKSISINSVAFSSDKIAFIELDKCMECGCCIDACKYGAISANFVVNELLCEGCGACHFKCPQAAIRLDKVDSAEIIETETSIGKIISALPEIGKNYNPQLISAIKNFARACAKKEKKNLIILGASEISKLDDTAQILFILEPSNSSFIEFKKLIPDFVERKNKVMVCINKFDINAELTSEIERICFENSLELIEKIPYSEDFTKANLEGKTIIEYDKCSIVSQKLLSLFAKIKEKSNAK